MAENGISPGSTAIRTAWESLPSTLDPGWASVIAAVIALGAAFITASVGIAIIKKQAQLGFDALVRSQANQAQLDREARAEQAGLDRSARDHQAQLERHLERVRHNDERENLAGSLAGELLWMSHAIGNGKAARAAMIALYEAHPDTTIDKPALLWPELETPVFAANVARIGILGPSIATDTVMVWQLPRARLSPDGMVGMPGRTVALAIRASEVALDAWQQDMSHVHSRLMSVYGAIQDPGSLLENRRLRQQQAGREPGRASG